MAELSYPLTGYDAQYALQDAIFDYYGVQIHICVLDPTTYKINSKEEMQELIAGYGPIFVDTEFEQDIDDSLFDPDTIHIEVASSQSNADISAIKALVKLTRGSHVSIESRPPLESKYSAGRVIVKDPTQKHRITFEFSHTLDGSIPNTENPTDLVIQHFRTWFKQSVDTQG